MVRLVSWYLTRKGYTVLRTREYEAAMGEVRHLAASIEKSGHLSTVSGRRPSVVRRLDRRAGRAEALFEAAVPKLGDGALGEIGSAARHGLLR